MKSANAKLLVAAFENGTLPKAAWTHEAHFVMALWYCYQFPLPLAKEKITGGIKKYNVAIGGINTDESGYHETITLFYIYTTSQYILQAPTGTSLEDLLNELAEQYFLAKNFPMQYYSRDLLLGKQARKEWVAPDKKSFCMTPPITVNYTL